jgi:hypothetical protein
MKWHVPLLHLDYLTRPPLQQLFKPLCHGCVKTIHVPEKEKKEKKKKKEKKRKKKKKKEKKRKKRKIENTEQITERNQF